MRMQKLVTFFRQTFVTTVLLGNLSLLLMPARVALANEDPNLIISAIQITGGTGHTQEDFIELYNPSDLPFDLNGHRLVKRTAAGTSDTLLKAWIEPTIVLPHRFYLWANSSFTTISKTPDATSTGTLADNNGVALRFGEENLGDIIDAVVWGSTANGFPTVSSTNPTANTSLLREDLFSEQASFIMALSSPRNSSDEVLPEPLPEPEPDPEPDPAPIPVPEPDPEPVPEPTPVLLKITELLPNPAGEDAGFEKIEIHNLGSQTVNLNGLILDDIAATDEVSTNAYEILDLQITSDEYLAITIPAGKFALNNSGGDVVTLFNKQFLPLDSAFYEETTPENMSWSYFSSAWAWAPQTLGEANGLAPEPQPEDDSEDDSDDDTDTEPRHDNSGLVISEIYADPNSGDKEFLEIQNTGEETAELSEVELYVGTKHKLLPEGELESGEFFVVTQDQLPAQLRNSGQTLALKDGSETLDSLNYPKAVKGSSYARFEDGFLWTTKLTEGETNILVLPQVIKEEVTKIAEKTTAKTSAKSSPKTASKSSPKSASKTTAKATPPAAPKTNQSEAANPQVLGESTKKPQNNSLGKIIAMGAAAVAAGVIALYKFVLSAGVE